MALGDTGINTTNVGAEIGQPSLDSWSQLVGYASINKYSRYAPGTLGVDSNKNITLSPPGSNYKIGDFRRYDHSSLAPHWFGIGTQYHNPGTTSKNVILIMLMEWLNLQCFTTSGVDTGTNPAHFHVRVDVYTSSANRIAQTGAIQNIYPIPVDMVADTPLSGHTRQSNWVMNTGANQIQTGLVANMNVGSGDVTRYCDVYFCDSSGANRIVNFGTSVSAGYYDMVCHEMVNPSLSAGGNTGYRPDVNWTVTYPLVDSAATPRCASSSIGLTFGGSTYSFYLTLGGVRSTSAVVGATGDVRMNRYDPIYGSESQIISSAKVFNTTNKVQLSGTLAGWSKGNTWYYDESVTITIENIGSFTGYAMCP